MKERERGGQNHKQERKSEIKGKCSFMKLFEGKCPRPM